MLHFLGQIFFFTILILSFNISFSNAENPCTTPILKLLTHNNSSQFLKFKLADWDVQNEVLKKFLQQKAAGSFENKIDSHRIKRVLNKHLDDLSSMDKFQIKNLTSYGLMHIEELSVVTSGAGLWTRGGGQVKALVPYNLTQLLGNDFPKLSSAGKIIIAENNDEIKINAKATIKAILDKIIYDPRAINALDMKFINLAIIYQKTGKYVNLDIWTSENTHSAIANYLGWLKKNIHQKFFHPNQAINTSIKNALDKYFKNANKLLDHHLFAYQEGLYAINVATGRYQPKTPLIGKGAGAIIEYLKKSGRMDLLKSRGVKTIAFENIEIVSDYVPLFASHRMGAKPVSVVLVPQRKGYIGGSPFLIQKPNGEWNLELIEQNVLSDEFKKGNEYFNTNTIFFSTEVRPLQTMGFELKEQNTIARVKQNMGDVTFDNPTHGILGRLGKDQPMVDYENFKSYDEYGENGVFYINLFQNNWETMLGYL